MMCVGVAMYTAEVTTTATVDTCNRTDKLRRYCNCNFSVFKMNVICFLALYRVSK